MTENTFVMSPYSKEYLYLFCFRLLQQAVILWRMNQTLFFVTLCNLQISLFDNIYGERKVKIQVFVLHSVSHLDELAVSSSF
jgi:hypothetical protein